MSRRNPLHRYFMVLGPGLVTVDVGIHYSKFSFSTLRVRAGTLVRFVVHNNDPIHHEFIVGDRAVHRGQCGVTSFETHRYRLGRLRRRQ